MLRLRAVEPGHWLHGRKPSTVLHPDGRRFWKRAGLHPANTCVVIENAGHIVAFLRFQLTRTPSGGNAHMLGSWVHPAYRGAGLARRLWRYALRRFRIRNVAVCTVSPAGRRLVAAIAADHFNVSFTIT